MTRTNSATIGHILRQAAHDFVNHAGDILRSVMRLPMPHLVAFCLACALFITILPLALCLFVGFLVCKLIAFLVAPPLSQATDERPARQDE